MRCANLTSAALRVRQPRSGRQSGCAARASVGRAVGVSRGRQRSSSNVRVQRTRSARRSALSHRGVARSPLPAALQRPWRRPQPAEDARAGGRSLILLQLGPVLSLSHAGSDAPAAATGCACASERACARACVAAHLRRHALHDLGQLYGGLQLRIKLRRARRRHHGRQRHHERRELLRAAPRRRRRLYGYSTARTVRPGVAAALLQHRARRRDERHHDACARAQAS